MSDITLKLYNHYQRQGRQDLADAVLNLHKANERYSRLLEMYLGVSTILPLEGILEECDPYAPVDPDNEYGEIREQDHEDRADYMTPNEAYEDYAQSFGYDRAGGRL